MNWIKKNWFNLTIAISIACSFFLFFFLYFKICESELSTNISDWSAFGSYFSGILLPILTALNIWVYIKLTYAIKKSNELQQSNEAKYQEERHRNEMDFQRKTLISQFRASKLDNFANIFNDFAIIDKTLISTENYIPALKTNIQLCMATSESFNIQNKELFGYSDEDDIFVDINKLHKLLTELSYLVNNDKLIDNRIREIIDLKNKIITKLQSIIINYL